MEPNIQRREALLSVEHCLQTGHGGRRAVDGIMGLPLIIVRDELVEIVVLGGFRIDSPK